MAQPASPLPAPPAPDTQDGEPLAFVGGIGAVISAIIALLVGFGVPWTPTQQSAVLGVALVVAPLATALVGRSRVFSPKTVAAFLSAVSPTYARTGTIATTPPPPGPVAGPPTTP